MARARNIKPSIFKNEVLGQADPLFTILFESLWCLADKAGRLEDRPLRIKAETFPYRDGLDINKMLTQLVSLEFIWRYKVGNKDYIQVINFDKHQSPHSTEKPSEIPECPPEYQVNTPVTGTVPLNNESHAVNGHINVLIPDSLLLIPDTPITTLSDNSDAITILEHLNLKASRKYKITNSNIALIKSRLKEHTFDELIAVIDQKCADWKNDKKMVEYLRPSTLFNATKCGDYVGSLKSKPTIRDCV